MWWDREYATVRAKGLCCGRLHGAKSAIAISQVLRISMVEANTEPVTKLTYTSLREHVSFKFIGIFHIHTHNTLTYMKTGGKSTNTKE